MFEWERQRVGVAGGTPYAFDLSLESPFFNRYESHSSSSSAVVLALASLPAGNATGVSECLTQCGANGRCLAVLLQPSPGQGDLHVDLFCIPDPSLLRSTVFSLRAPFYQLEGSDAMRTQQVPLKHTHTHECVLLDIICRHDTNTQIGIEPSPVRREWGVQRKLDRIGRNCPRWA